MQSSPRPPLRDILMVLVAVVVVLAGGRGAWSAPPASDGARATYGGVFAPQAGRVVPVERPFRDEMCLNGNWAFQAIPLPTGFQIGIMAPPALAMPQAGGWEATPIRIPSPWNANSFAHGDRGEGGDYKCFPSYPPAWEHVYMAWMRKSVTVPAAWQGKRVLLRFGAIAGDARILVNGQEVGSHFDLFLPYEVDVTAALRPGQANEILVGVRRPALFNQIQGKMGYRPYPGGSFWGPHVAGIWQDVTLCAVPSVHVSDVFVKPQVDQDVLEVEVTVRNDGPSAAQASVGGDVRPWVAKELPLPSSDYGEKVLAVAAGTLSIPSGQAARAVLRQKVGGALRPWSPESPSLYGLVLRVQVQGQDTDCRCTRFGWRQFKLAGQKLTLNGKPVLLKGEAWHFMGIPQMSRRYAWGWYKMARDAGANAVRLHAQPYPEFYLDVADEMGILVLDETAIWASDGGPKVDSPEFWTRCRDHVRALVLRDRNHPSIYGWSVENETLGVIRGVYRSPASVVQGALDQFAAWVASCRELDSTREWISGDGDGDGEGRFPVALIHYPDPNLLRRWAQKGKLWGVGESGMGYNGTPREVSAFNGERAYESAEGRMEGLAVEAYKLLREQQAAGAGCCSVFNLAWYGLRPLELGMRDTTRPPRDTDGIFFPPLVEGQPGVQPERLGPYCTTINPGFDGALPLYRPWPLFEGIRDGFAGTPGSRWASMIRKDVQASPGGSRERAGAPWILGAPQGPLGGLLKSQGVSVSPVVARGALPAVLFVDGVNPPQNDPGARDLVDMVARNGGTVFVVGASALSLVDLNAMLPYPLAIADRRASSLVPVGRDPLVEGVSPAALYFSELQPWMVLDGGLGGPFVEKGQVLLKACEADWRQWNGRPEYTKTASLLRSEREAKPSGAAMVSLPVGKGRIVVFKMDLPLREGRIKDTFARILRNLGVK